MIRLLPPPSGCALTPTAMDTIMSFQDRRRRGDVWFLPASSPSRRMPFRNYPQGNARRGAFRVPLALPQEHGSPDLPSDRGRASFRVRLQSASVHAPALGLSSSANSTIRSAMACLLLRSLSSERCLLPHHGACIALPVAPTYQRSGRVCANTCSAPREDDGHAHTEKRHGPHATDGQSRTRQGSS
jgi:hypothetical protein